jgi:hypothetical protein
MPNESGAAKENHCWMCTYSTENLTKMLNAFVTENIPNIAMRHITEQIRAFVLLSFPEATGAETDDIRRHIEEHMVAPEVKMACSIRSLSAIADVVRAGITRVDEESGDMIIDSKQVELYLKVMNQINSSYRVDTKKMMFSSGAN